MAQQLGAHHGGQRERHARGNQNGHAQGDGKFAEQASHDIAHEEQRNKYGDERYRQRNNRETDLPGTLESGVKR